MLAAALGSGAAALVYQVVWMRRLAVVFGSTTLATSTVLAAFLGGLAVGAWVFGRVADRWPRDTLAAFGLVEAALGLYALASPWAFGGADAAYLAAFARLDDRPTLLTGLPFVLGALVIVPPAALMGGSLPLLARRLVAAPADAGRGVGALYGWNTVGAGLGAAGATYGLLPAFGLSGAVRLAAAVNLLVAAAALLADARDRRQRLRLAPGGTAPPPGTAAPSHAGGAGLEERERAGGGGLEERAGGAGLADLAGAAAAPERAVADRLRAPTDGLDPVAVLLVLQGFALSGFAAMSYEVAWARLLALSVGSSVYAFGTLLVVVLIGLGAGSALYARRLAAPAGHQRAFALLEALIAASAAGSLLVLPHLPALFVRFYPVYRDAFGWQVAAYVGAAAVVALVPALLFGATFPAVVGATAGHVARLGRSLGTAYVANTIGTVLGAFLSGFVLVPALGLRATVVVGVLANLAAAAAALVGPGASAARAPALVAAAVAVAVLATLPPWPREVFAAGFGFFASRFGSLDALQRAAAESRLLYYRDGINTTISVDRVGEALYYRSNGKTDASTEPSDMATQMLLGHLPMLRHPGAREVFVLGLGTGVTAAAVARYPVARVDIAELEPAGLEAARFFERVHRGVLDDPRVRVLVGDGRHRLRAAAQTYDVVISDPSDLWVAGIGALYTVEFYREAAARLRPGGVMVQWVHTHALAPADLRLLVGTFHRVFPYTEIWAPAWGDLILLGLAAPTPWDYGAVRARLAGAPGVAEDLRAIGIWHPAALFAGYVLGGPRVVALTGAVPPHTDDRPALEFSTPRALYAPTDAAVVSLLESLRAGPFPAMTGFDPAHELDPHTTYLLGFAYASLGRVRHAIPLMEEAVRRRPGHAAYWVGLAHQYRAAGRGRDAEAAYRRALALEPRHVEAMVGLGEALLAAGDVGGARALAAAARRLAPDDARVQALIDALAARE